MKHAKEIMRLIMLHIASLRTLEVNKVPHKILRVILDRLAGASAPQLQKLTAIAKRKTTLSQVGAPINWKFKSFIQGEAQSLRELNLLNINPSRTVNYFKDLRTLRLKWAGVFGAAQSTAYERVKSVQGLLTTLPNLKYILLGDGVHHHLWPGFDDLQLLPVHLPPPITHSTLTYISIGASLSTANAIVASLILPELKFAIDRQQNELLIGVSCLEGIAKSNPCPLSGLISLRLGAGCSSANRGADPRNSINMGYLEGALARLEHLRSLTLYEVDFENDQYLACLGRTCPKLEWLRLLVCQGFTMKQVRSVVETRLAAKTNFCPLVRLIIDQWSYENPLPCEEGDREWLEGVVKLGINKYPNDSGEPAGYRK
ncbi:hypothetical protein FRC01_008624 [Tulasnella sp. 417]|nr:hypothetical protein FRC01_008624 [Tulasnella sp. 417]